MSSIRILGFVVVLFGSWGVGKWLIVIERSIGVEYGLELFDVTPNHVILCRR
jgi:RecA-family ATPase